MCVWTSDLPALPFLSFFSLSLSETLFILLSFFLSFLSFFFSSFLSLLIYLFIYLFFSLFFSIWFPFNPFQDVLSSSLSHVWTLGVISSIKSPLGHLLELLEILYPIVKTEPPQLLMEVLILFCPLFLFCFLDNIYDNN